MKKHLLTLAIGGTIFLAGYGASGLGAEENPAVHSEIHTITKVTADAIYGENITGEGEGIYFTKDTYQKFGQNFQAGDKVEVQWTEEAVLNWDWDQVHSLREVRK